MLLFWFLPLVCSAQGEEHGEVAERNIPLHAFKWSPYHLINFYPTVQLAYERRLKERFSLQADMGIVLRRWLGQDFGNTEFENKRGVKLKLEARFYLKRQRLSNAFDYLSVEPYWNRINFDRSETLTECFDVNCQSQFRRTYRYEMKYREPGLSAKYGIMLRFNHFIADFNGGISLRFVNYIRPDWVEQLIPEDNFNGGWFEIPNERKRVGVSPALGVRIGWAF